VNSAIQALAPTGTTLHSISVTIPGSGAHAVLLSTSVDVSINSSPCSANGNVLVDGNFPSLFGSGNSYGSQALRGALFGSSDSGVMTMDRTAVISMTAGTAHTISISMASSNISSQSCAQGSEALISVVDLG